jgi:hypothetical protein
MNLSIVLSVKRLPDNLRERTAVSSTQNIIDKIRLLETEKESLLVEVEELKKAADLKASALESEVNALRDEMRLLKIMMNVTKAHDISKTKGATNSKNLRMSS